MRSVRVSMTRRAPVIVRYPGRRARLRRTTRARGVPVKPRWRAATTANMVYAIMKLGRPGRPSLTQRPPALRPALGRKLGEAAGRGSKSSRLFARVGVVPVEPPMFRCR
jgi:hypothetical protein